MICVTGAVLPTPTNKTCVCSNDRSVVVINKFFLLFSFVRYIYERREQETTFSIGHKISLISFKTLKRHKYRFQRK